MKQPSGLLKPQSTYFTGLLLSLLTGLALLLYAGKAASFLLVNNYHNFGLNVLFINYTFMGDGIFALCIVLFYVLYLKKKQEGINLLYAFLLSGIAVQVIKNLISAPRPRLFFEPGRYSYFLDQIALANNASFPSGHTATAFAIATVLAMHTKNKFWQFVLLIAAVMVGYSRIYLAQHFLEDILAGAAIGSFSGVFAVVIAKSRLPLFRRKPKPGIEYVGNWAVGA